MTHATPDILCIGSVLWDIIGRAEQELHTGADVPGRITRLPGGVAMNVAMTLARLGLRPSVLTTIGHDPEGEELIAACAARGVDCSHVHRSAHLATDRYLAVEGANGLIAAIADARSLETAGAAILAPLLDGRLGRPDAPWAGPVALDGNLTEQLLAEIGASPAFAAADLKLAPASPGKAERLRVLLGHPRTTLYVNLEEAGLICRTAFADAAAAARGLIAQGASRVLVTAGPQPCADGAPEGVIVRSPPPVTVQRITGAGDTFMASHILAETRGADRATALETALAAAAAYVSGEIGS